MLRTDEFVSGLNCPVCNRKRLRIWMCNGGEGNSQVYLVCKGCGAFITSNLIPNVDDWIVEKPRKNKNENKGFKGERLWNQP